MKQIYIDIATMAVLNFLKDANSHIKVVADSTGAISFTEMTVFLGYMQTMEIASATREDKFPLGSEKRRHDSLDFERVTRPYS
ncbi:unnamed protein product [Brassica rapa subsp. narinosa]